VPRAKGPDSAGEGPRRSEEPTAQLIARAKSGDRDAKESLSRRYLDALKRFAHGRMPASARGMIDTDDLVQSAVARVLDRIEEFEDRGSGAMAAYLRQIILNRIRDEARRAAVRGPHSAIGVDTPSRDLSPVEVLAGWEVVQAYDVALSRLKPACRELIIKRLELGFRYREIAEAMGIPSANAARMRVAQCLDELRRALRGFHGQ
jgi:RNA polymerase sigma-70 factor (ECF subfamily)